MYRERYILDGATSRLTCCMNPPPAPDLLHGSLSSLRGGDARPAGGVSAIKASGEFMKGLAKQSSGCSSGSCRAARGRRDKHPRGLGRTRFPPATGATALDCEGPLSSHFASFLLPPSVFSLHPLLLPSFRSLGRVCASGHLVLPAPVPLRGGGSHHELRRNAGLLPQSPQLLLQTLRWTRVRSPVTFYTLGHNHERLVSFPSGSTPQGSALSGRQATCRPDCEQLTPAATSRGRGCSSNPTSREPPAPADRAGCLCRK